MGLSAPFILFINPLHNAQARCETAGGGAENCEGSCRCRRMAALALRAAASLIVIINIIVRACLPASAVYIFVSFLHPYFTRRAPAQARTQYDESSCKNC